MSRKQFDLRDKAGPYYGYERPVNRLEIMSKLRIIFITIQFRVIEIPTTLIFLILMDF